MSLYKTKVWVGAALSALYTGAAAAAMPQPYSLQMAPKAPSEVHDICSRLHNSASMARETLRRFARNNAGETIPPDVVAKLNASRGFGEAVETARQIGLAHIDLDYHQKEPIAGGTRE